MEHERFPPATPMAGQLLNLGHRQQSVPKDGRRTAKHSAGSCLGFCSDVGNRSHRHYCPAGCGGESEGCHSGHAARAAVAHCWFWAEVPPRNGGLRNVQARHRRWPSREQCSFSVAWWWAFVRLLGPSPGTSLSPSLPQAAPSACLGAGCSSSPGPLSNRLSAAYAGVGIGLNWRTTSRKSEPSLL